MAADELPRAGSASASPSPPFSFVVWPPTRRTRDAVVRRLVAVLSGEGAGDTTTALRKRYGAVPAADAEHAARAVEAEAFDAASASASAAPSSSSVEDGIETLQLYSREVSNRLLAFVRSRSSAAGAPFAAAAAGEVA